MPPGTEDRVLIDDRLLIEQLLVGLPQISSSVALYTTGYWYYRACRAAVAGAGGHLSGPFERLNAGQQARAILTLLQLPDEIDLPNLRDVVPVMADVVLRHPRLNLLNLEAVAAAHVLAASLCLSEQTAAGLLPSVLDAESVEWTVVALGRL
jgi:hypothetical protein